MSPTFSFKQSCKSIMAAGFPSWLPSAITTIGSQAGTIIVFGTSGSSQAGTYFIAFSIFSAIFMITSSLVSVAFPALSAMGDGRKRFSWRITKISLIVSLPLSCSLIFYSDEILGLLSQDYVRETASLQILLLSILPTAVMTSINTLVYAYGNYKTSFGNWACSKHSQSCVLFCICTFLWWYGSRFELYDRSNHRIYHVNFNSSSSWTKNIMERSSVMFASCIGSSVRSCPILK